MKGIKMSENTSAVETTDAPVETLPPSAFDGVYAQFKAETEAANAIAAQVRKATDGVQEAIETWLTNSDDPEIVKWREDDARVRAQIAEAEARLAEAKAQAVSKAEEAVKADSDTIDLDAAQKEFLARRANATAIRKTLLVLEGNNEDRLNKYIEQYGITEVVSLKKGGTVTGSTGKRKPRLLSASVNGDAVEPATFTNLAKVLGADLDALKASAFKAAGTEDLMGDKGGQEISFDYATKDNGVAKVVIVPKVPGSTEKSE